MHFGQLDLFRRPQQMDSVVDRLAVPAAPGYKRSFDNRRRMEPVGVFCRF